MITKIELKNFMSHTSTVIEPAAGLTVLVGPNNCGKSAVIAALQIVSHNDNSTYVLRHGEKACSIKIETDDGNSVEWRRKNSPSYVINGQTFDRLKGAGLPEELPRALRLPPVTAGNNQTFDVHFGEQKSPIFLLDQPGSCAASFFASSSDAIRLVEMQKLHRNRLSDAQREKERLEKEAKQLNDELASLLPMNDVDQALRELEIEHGQLTQLATTIEQAMQVENLFRRISIDLASHNSKVRILESLNPPPQMHASAPLADLCKNIEIAEKAFARLLDVECALSSLTVPPHLADTESFEAHCANIRRAQTHFDRIHALHESLTSLASPPSLANELPFEVLCANIRREQANFGRIHAKHESLVNLKSPPSLPDELPLLTSCQQLANAFAHHRRADARYGIIKSLPETPALQNVLDLSNLHKDLSRRLRESDYRRAARESLIDLAAPPPIAETQSLMRIIAQIGDAERKTDFANTQKDVLSNIGELPISELDAQLDLVVKTLSAVVQRFRRCELVSVQLGSLTDLPVLADTAPVEKMLDGLRVALNDVVGLVALVQFAQAKLDQAVADLQNWAAEAKVCPTCGGAIDPDKILAQAQHCESSSHA